MRYEYPTTQLVLGHPVTRTYKIKCPTGTHRDSTPSFTIYPNGSFKCYGCGVHGKHGLDFLMKALGNSYRDSIEYLKEKGLVKTIDN